MSPARVVLGTFLAKVGVVLLDVVEVPSNGWAESPAIGATEKAPKFAPHCGGDQLGVEAAPLPVLQPWVRPRQPRLPPEELLLCVRICVGRAGANA